MSVDGGESSRVCDTAGGEGDAAAWGAGRRCSMVFTPVGGSGGWLLLPSSCYRGKGWSVCSREREGRAKGGKDLFGQLREE